MSNYFPDENDHPQAGEPNFIDTNAEAKPHPVSPETSQQEQVDDAKKIDSKAGTKKAAPEKETPKGKGK